MTTYLVQLMISIFLLAFTATISFSDENSCEQLISTKCTACHYNTRICVRLTKKSKRAWKRTVKNMIRHGADVSKDELKKVVVCLNEPSPEVTAWCEKKD